MGGILKEIGNTYNKWTVIDRYDSPTSSAAWLCRCECGYERPILGVDLRRRKLPLCTNCCRICGKTREQVEFKGNKRTCQKCNRKRIREWRRGNKNHKDKITTWLQRNPEAVSRHRQNERTRIQSNPENFLRAAFKDRYRKHKRLSKSLDLRTQQKAKSPERCLISISEDQICALWDQQSGKCAISGMQMVYKFKDLCSVSIDRVNPAEGYTSGNTQLVCRWVNWAKNNFSDTEIRRVLREFQQSARISDKDI